MINTVGSFSLIWLTLCCALTIVFRLVYPMVRPTLFRLHPHYGVDLLLRWWAAPMMLSLLASLRLQPWQLLMIVLMLCSALMLALDPLHHSAEQLIA